MGVLTFRKKVALVSVAIGLVSYHRQSKLAAAAKKRRLVKSVTDAKDKKKRVSRSVLWKQILALLKLKTDRTGHQQIGGIMICTFAFMLIDLRKARLQGELFKAVFLGDRKEFFALLPKNIIVEFALTCFNKILANVVSSLGRNWNKLIVDGIHDEYFSDM